MAKQNPLAQAINNRSQTAAVTTETAPVTSAKSPKGGSSREGRVLVGGFYAVEVQKALKILAAEEGSTVQALLAEGINTVLAKRGKPEIANMSARIMSVA